MAHLGKGPEKDAQVWFSTSRATRLPPHEHSSWEVNLILGGSLSYQAPGETVSARQGDLLLIPPELRHELTSCSTDLSLWVIQTGTSLNLDGLPIGQISRIACTPDHEVKLSQLAHAHWLARSRRDSAALLSELVKVSMSRAAVPIQAQEAARLRHPAVRKARLLAEQGERDISSVAELARRVGLSPSRLTHLFQREVGISPIKFLNYCRVQTFVSRWQGRDENLLESALGAGFGSYAQFHRVFRQVCGASPAEHRRWLIEQGIDPSLQMGRAPLRVA